MDIETRFLKTYDDCADAVFRHCYFRVHDRELARDLTQEAFTRAWGYLRQGKAVANPKAFVFRTANNLIIDHYRKKKESSLDALAENGFDPSGDEHERMEMSADGKEALSLLGKLEEQYREVVTLRYVSGLSIGEIAAITGQSQNAVSVRLHRALKKLRDYFNHGSP